MRGVAQSVRSFVDRRPGAMVTGCATASPDVPNLPGARHRSPRPTARASSADQRPKAVRSVSPPRTEPAPPPSHLDLESLLALARTHHPDLAAAAAESRRRGDAWSRPDSTRIRPWATRGTRINDGPGTAGQQGGFVSQEFVTGGKLEDRPRGRPLRCHGCRLARRFEVVRHRGAREGRVLRIRHRGRRPARNRADGDALRRGADSNRKARRRGPSRCLRRFAAEGRGESRSPTGSARPGRRLAAAERMLIRRGRRGSTCRADVACRRLARGFAAVPAFDEATGLAGRSSFVLAAAAEAEQARVEVRAAEVKASPERPDVMTMAMHDYVDPRPDGERAGWAADAGVGPQPGQHSCGRQRTLRRGDGRSRTNPSETSRAA